MAGYARPYKKGDMTKAAESSPPLADLAVAKGRISGATRLRISGRDIRAAGEEHRRREYGKKVYNPLYRRPQEIMPSKKTRVAAEVVPDGSIGTSSRSSYQTE